MIAHNRRERMVRDTILAALGEGALTYHQLLAREILSCCDSLLDVGCGSDSPVQVFSQSLRLTVGVDAHQPSLDRARAKGIHHRYECLELNELSERFSPQTFDAVVALDVIEHLDAPAGLLLLESLELIARKKVIVFTPNGFLAQGVQDENPWQIHRSSWHVRDFDERGYRVLGINGLRCLRTERAAHRLWPSRLGDLACRATQLVTIHRPELAFQLLAIRDVARD